MVKWGKSSSTSEQVKQIEIEVLGISQDKTDIFQCVPWSLDENRAFEFAALCVRWCWSSFFLFLRSLSERKTAELKISHNWCEVKILKTLENVFNDGEWIKTMIILTSKYLLSTAPPLSSRATTIVQISIYHPPTTTAKKAVPSLRREMENNFPKICQINNTRAISGPFIRAPRCNIVPRLPPPPLIKI